MTLKNRIALTFTILTSLILALILCTVYYITSRYNRQEFLRRLYDRAEIAAQVVLEQDELNQRLLAEIRRKHLQTLTEEREFMLSLPYSRSDSPELPAFLNPEAIETLSKRGKIDFQDGRRLGVGIKYVDNQGTFAMFVTAFDQYGQAKLQNLARVILFVWLFYLFAVFFIGRWYGQRILRPIGELSRRMQTVNASNLHLRLPADGNPNDELHQLNSTFNRMLDRLAISVEAQKQFISNASHQLKNPLTAILGEVETALAAEDLPQEQKQTLNIIAEETRRLETLILQLLRLAQATGADHRDQFTTFRLDDVLFELAEELHTHPTGGHLKLDSSYFPEDSARLTIEGQRYLIKIALANILENALKFSGEEVEVALKVTDKHLLVCIIDHGIGIAPDDLSKIFAPFYRAQNARPLPGFGIGLSLAQKIVQMHDGKLEVESELGRGTAFRIFFPR